MVSVIRVWADDDDESHLEDVDLEFEEQVFVPPAPPVLIASPGAAAGYVFARVPPGWQKDRQPASQRELVIYFRGEGMIETSDGDSRQITPGMVLLAEDTTGKGHASRVTGTEEMFLLIVTLPD